MNYFHHVICSRQMCARVFTERNVHKTRFDQFYTNSRNKCVVTQYKKKKTV